MINLPTTGVSLGTYRLIGYSGALGGTSGFNAFTLGTSPAWSAAA